MLKKTVLELGGSDPFIVLPDVDVDATARAAADARCINSGQSCIAAKRFIVVGPIADDVRAGIRARREASRSATRSTARRSVGPLARADLRDDLHEQVERVDRRRRPALSPAAHAPRRPRLLLRAHSAGRRRPGMPAFDEETFGPVAAMVRAATRTTRSAWPTGPATASARASGPATSARAERIAAEIEAGCVFVNGPVKSDPSLPFGGIKQSGYGRELAAEGIREFVNVKTVWVKEWGKGRSGRMRPRDVFRSHSASRSRPRTSHTNSARAPHGMYTAELRAHSPR